MGHISFGLLVIALFASANAFFPLIPEGKELVYHYHGMINAGTHLPTHYASAFILDGHLHVQTDKNSSYMHFSDLKYKLYNGDYDIWHEFETKQIPLPKELEVLEHPFKVVYEPCGHAWGIVVEENEPQYVVNVKRGIASMMQMYTEKLDWETTYPYAFHAKEETLYGKGPTYYTVFPGHEEWTVKKMVEPHSNHHLTAHMHTNTKMATCDATYDEPLSRDSSQDYHIVVKDGQHVVDHLESRSEIGYTPHAGEAYGFFIYMNQTLTLEKIEAATPMTLKSEKFYHGLTYNYADFNTMESIADIFHGRRTYDMDKMMAELEEMLYDTMKYTKEYHLDMKQPDWARGQLVNRMLIILFQFDQAHLETMTAKLMQKTTEEDKEALHVYYHMLPLIGSHASYMYMMKLMKTKKIKDKQALEWLHTTPFYVKEPNKMLLDHMSEMLNWGDEISVDVRKAAILCFGTMIDKAIFRYRKINHMVNWNGHEDHHDIHDDFTPDFELDAVFPGPKYYEKYVTMLGEKMKAAKDIGMRATYLAALSNTHLEKGIQYLWPIARGEMWTDNFLQLAAIKSLGSMVHNNDDLIYEIFWPIMCDYKLNTNLRVAAYYEIMKSHPSLARLINVYWQMVNEPNVALYQFHYSYFENVARTTDPCMEHFRIHVKQIMRYTERPEGHTITGYYAFDYYDTKYEYGHQFSSMIINAPWESETTMKFRMGFTTDHAKFPQYSMLLRIDGMEASIFEDVVLYMKDPTKMFNFERVWKAYQNIYNNKDIRIDVVVLMYGQVVTTCNYDATNIKDFSQFLDFFIGDKYNYVRKYFNIAYPVQTNVIMPTDMGFPALFKYYIPKVFFFDFKINKEIINKMITYQFDMHFKEWSHGRIGLSFYNPIIDAYQGVQRQNAFELVQPFYFDLSFNPAQQSMKLSWKRHDDPQKDAYGVKTYAATFTFVRDDMHKNKLQESSPDSQEWAMVTFGEDYMEDKKIIYDNDCSNTGYHHMVAKFESDAYATNSSIFRYYNFLNYEQNYHTWVGHWFLTRFHVLTHAFMQPYPYANGILIRSEVSKQYPVTNADLNMRFTREYKREGEMMLYPATKWNLRGTYSLKNHETTMKTWDLNMILDSDMGHTTTNMKAIFSRIIPGQKEWRVCFDGNRKYTTEGLEGEATIAMTHSTEPKCSKDETILDIHVKAEKLPEQLDNKHLYGQCEEHMWSDLHELNSLDCYFARDTLRKWIYDFKSHNMPTEFQKYMKGFFEYMKLSYMKYFTKYDANTMALEKDTWRIVHEYPLIGDKVDLHVYTPENDFKFGGIPSHKYPYYSYHMMTTRHISPLFRFMHKMGWTQMCEIHPEHVTNATFDSIEYTMPTEWTMYLGEADTDAKHGIWMKSMPDHFSAVKMMHGEHYLEITPTGHKTYDIMVDGKKLPEHTYQYQQDWFWMDLVKETGVFSIYCMHTGSHIAYDGHHLLHERPNMDVPFYGKCA